jgi:thiol:disulfide interchange protein
MRKTKIRPVLPVLVSLAVSQSLVPGPLSGQGEGDVEDALVVAEYDASRDPAADLELAVARAQAEGKRILLEIGGEWCGWCHRLDAFIREHPAVAEALTEGFVMMKVNYSRENRNEAFLSKYPEIPGYPHLYVLESDGTFLHSQGTAELEEGQSYDEEALVGFLRAWAPEGG